MSSVSNAAVRENNVPRIRGRRPTKFTPENIAKIKDWVAHGVTRNEIANRLEVTVSSLQVTCSKLGISLRRRALANADGAKRSIEGVRQGDHAARTEFRLLIQDNNGQAAIHLPLSQDLIWQLALEALIRDRTIADLVVKILTQVMEKDFIGEILHNHKSPSNV